MSRTSTLRNRLFRSVAAVAIFAAAVAAGTTAPAREAVVQVKGLACPVCARRLQKVLIKLPGAKESAVCTSLNLRLLPHGGEHATPQRYPFCCSRRFWALRPLVFTSRCGLPHKILFQARSIQPRCR